jgi:hypothetical protein
MSATINQLSSTLSTSRYFLSTTSSSASLAIVLRENDAAADLPTILEGRLTGLPESLFTFTPGLPGVAPAGGLPALFLFRFCTRLCTLPPPGVARGPRASRGPSIPVD